MDKLTDYLEGAKEESELEYQGSSKPYQNWFSMLIIFKLKLHVSRFPRVSKTLNVIFWTPIKSIKVSAVGDW